MIKKEKKFVCDLCNTEAENETKISAVPQTPLQIPEPYGPLESTRNSLAMSVCIQVRILAVPS